MTGTADKNDVVLSLHFNRTTFEAAKKIGRDLVVSVGLNAASFATNALPVAQFGQTLSDKFTLCAIGTAVTAAGITAGRYVGGAVGAAVDAATHAPPGGKYRKALATVGGTIGGGATFAVYQSGMWALAGG